MAFGTTSIPADQWTIFYGRKGHTKYVACDSFVFDAHWLTKDPIVSRIDLSDASETELEHLSNACQPATFGVNQDDILDESYRKAGKLDVTDFATKIVVADSRLMDVVRSELLEGHESNRTIKAELYKLNVYGEVNRHLLPPCRVYLTHEPGKLDHSSNRQQGHASPSSNMFRSYLVIIIPNEARRGRSNPSPRWRRVGI